MRSVLTLSTVPKHPTLSRGSGAKNAPPFSKQAVRSLFSKLDFVGISAYHPLEVQVLSISFISCMATFFEPGNLASYIPIQVDFTAPKLQKSAASFLQEANSVLGIDVSKMFQDKGIELHYVGMS